MPDRLRILKVRSQRVLRDAIGQLVTLPRVSKRALKVGYDGLAVAVALAATHALTDFNVALVDHYVIGGIRRFRMFTALGYLMSFSCPQTGKGYSGG